MKTLLCYIQNFYYKPQETLDDILDFINDDFLIKKIYIVSFFILAFFFNLYIIIQTPFLTFYGKIYTFIIGTLILLLRVTVINFLFYIATKIVSFLFKINLEKYVIKNIILLSTIIYSLIIVIFPLLFINANILNLLFFLHLFFLSILISYYINQEFYLKEIFMFFVTNMIIITSFYFVITGIFKLILKIL